MAEAILRHRAAFITKHPPPAEVSGLLGLLPLCRTAALGGHLYRCGDCGFEQPRYNSCGNRHCPNCQVLARERWLARQEAALLEVPYFHVVFTLPGELQPLILQNKRAGYSALFSAASETLLKFGRDPKHRLTGQLGFTAVLHTWNQTLGPHAHLHLLVPAGALSADRKCFTRAKDGKWLFPVKALSQVFRAIFLKRLCAVHTKGELTFHGKLEPLNDPRRFAAHLDPLYRKGWVVYAKRPFAGPEQVLAYLGRYTHRVAISNARIREVTDDHVRFTYRDRKDPALRKTMRLDGPEFLRRFFYHVLPRGFTRIRHFGFLGNAVRKKNLPLIRNLLGQVQPTPSGETPIERIARLYDIDLTACSRCKTGRMEPLGKLVPTRCHDPPAA
ncbi:IS91 family transposase [Akkermansiaceae bacterium]|nr:IS91 family transposase [Akkermansiaceae bacterium]